MQRSIELRVTAEISNDRNQASTSGPVTSRIGPGNLVAKRFRVVRSWPRYLVLAPSCSRILSSSATTSGTVARRTILPNILPYSVAITDSDSLPAKVRART